MNVISRMESRYTTPEMATIWSDENKYKIWADIEFSVYETMVQLGQIPSSDYEDIRRKMEFWKSHISVSQILDFEKIYRHDIIAFLAWLETLSNGKTRFFHYGMTSSDLADTAFSLRLMSALTIISNELLPVCNKLSHLASRDIHTVTPGRTHGMNAQVTTLSNFFLGHYGELTRAYHSLIESMKIVRFGQLSGPVGAYMNISPEVEKIALEKLGLEPEPLSTQIIPRDRYADVMYTIVKCATAIERFAINIRHLHRTEVSEIKEGFKNDQKGSSSMPHKQNPITCENLCGLSRLIRGFLHPSIENCLVWHERDISHSSVERVIFPEATTYLHKMILSFTDLIDNLVIDRVQIAQHVEMNFETNISETLMLILIDRGMRRSEAHGIVAECMRSSMPLDFLTYEKKIVLTEIELDRIRNSNKRVQTNSELIWNRVRQANSIES